MDKFWKWMEEKDYSEIGSLKEELMVHNKQMLIGYMIEYHIENKIIFIIQHTVYYDIEKLYDALRDSIEKFN